MSSVSGFPKTRRYRDYHWPAVVPETQVRRTLDGEDHAAAREAFSDLVSTSRSIGDGMATYLHERIPELTSVVDEHALRADTEASCTANMDQILRLLGSGARVDELVVPAPALRYAETFVHRRIPLTVLLRSYRVGHAYFWNVASRALNDAIGPGELLGVALEASSNFMFDYIDAMSDELVAAYHLERDRWVRSAAAIRAETVRDVLEGRLENERAATVRLGYELRRTHVGLILAGEPETNLSLRGSSLEREAVEVAAILGCGDPLLVPAGAAVLWAWCGTFDPPSPEALSRVERHRPSSGVRMAVGRPGFGLEGFRVTHLEAGHASRFWDLGGGATATSYRSIELVSLLASDIGRARRFVLSELGPLADQADGAARLRSTLLGFLANGCSHVRAAPELHMHQNTVYNHVRRAEELLGGSVTERRVELQAALILAETLGPEVLPVA
jgi:PucR-like helix-turn-helix protein/diguanylate cyclase with GGDEF domain